VLVLLLEEAKIELIDALRASIPDSGLDFTIIKEALKTHSN
jgi:hypothetical protein